jgi:lambda family phage portal protein
VGSGYVVFGSGKKSMRGAFAFANPPEVDIDTKLEKMRASARDLFMNSPVATAILERFKTHVISSGLTLQCRVDRKFLGLSDEEADAWEENVEREFRLWSRSKNCDAYRRLNFNQMQALAFLSRLLSGDVFALLPYKKRAGWPYELCIKLIEADYVSNPNDAMDTETIVSGVETSIDGEVVAYHITNRHPNDLLGYARKWVKVPAYGAESGRPNVLHLFEPSRPGQRRGIPELAPVIESLKQITRLTEAELMAAVVTSFLTVFIETPAPTPLDGNLPSEEKITDPTNVAADQGAVELGNGSIVGLNPGEKATVIDPKRPNQAFDPFFMAISKQIGAAIGQPVEIVLQSFQSSYSASRAAWLQFWKKVLSLRNGFKQEFNTPIYEEMLAEAVSKGRISAPGFFNDPAYRAAWCGCDWIGPGMGQINPEVETKAAINKVNNLLSTRAKVVAEIDGDDWDAMFPT